MTVAGISAYSDPARTAVLSRGTTTPRVAEPAPQTTTEEKEITQPAQTAPVSGQEEQAFDLQKLQKATEQIEAAAAAVDVKLQFRIDSETNIVQMVITNPETDEVVLEIPPEDVLKAATSLRDIIGLLIDTTA